MYIYKYCYLSPCGELTLASYNNSLCLCDWNINKLRRERIDNKITKHLKTEFSLGRTEIIDRAIWQLDEYFAHKRAEFDITTLLIGTDFQKKVWSALQHIPYTTTISYKELSHSLNMNKATRAVASAVGANPLSIIIPCHRVIGSNGELRGYAGGLEAKYFLLKHENSDDKIFNY